MELEQLTWRLDELVIKAFKERKIIYAKSEGLKIIVTPFSVKVNDTVNEEYHEISYGYAWAITRFAIIKEEANKIYENSNLRK